MYQEISTFIEKNSRLVSTLKSTKNKSVSTSVLEQTIEECTDLLSQIEGNRKLVDVRKSLSYFNECQLGALRGVQEDELSRGELLSTVKHSLTFLAKTQQELDLSEERKQRSKFRNRNQEFEETEEDMDNEKLLVVEENKAKIEQSLSSDWKHALKRARHKLENAPTKDASSDVNPDEEKLKAKFKAWDEAAKNSPSTMNKQLFGITQLPVLPLYADFTLTQSENLAKFGIKHTMFEGYAVFENQKILYFSSKSAKKQNQKPIEFAEDLVDLINLRASSKFAIASDIIKHSSKNADIIMVWLLPERVLNSMLNKQMSAGGKRGKSAHMRDWSFPFIRSND